MRTCLMATTLIILTVMGAPVAGAPDTSAPKDARQLEPAEIASVIRCLVPQARGEGWRHERLAREHYTEEKLLAIGEAVLEGVRLAGLGPRYVPILIGTLYQQSKFQHDAISRYNRGKDGKLLRPRKDVWRRAQKGMDYGMFQHHWPFVWVPTIPPWNGARKPTLDELSQPRNSIILGAEWLRRKAETCEILAGSRRRRPCKKDRTSMSCRCVRTKRATGAWWVNGNPRSIGRIMKKVDACIADVRAVADAEAVGEL